MYRNSNRGGENFAVGLVDGTDTPYDVLVNTLRELGRDDVCGTRRNRTVKSARTRESRGTLRSSIHTRTRSALPCPVRTDFPWRSIR